MIALGGGHEGQRSTTPNEEPNHRAKNGHRENNESPNYSAASGVGPVPGNADQRGNEQESVQNKKKPQDAHSSPGLARLLMPNPSVNVPA